MLCMFTEQVWVPFKVLGIKSYDALACAVMELSTQSGRLESTHKLDGKGVAWALGALCGSKTIAPFLI